MEPRVLTVTACPDWRAALRDAAGVAFSADAYQGETLNFETPAAFFSRLTEKRWAMLHALQGAGEVPVRALARRLERDVKRVDEDAGVLVEMGLIERTERGGWCAPSMIFTSICI